MTRPTEVGHGRPTQFGGEHPPAFGSGFMGFGSMEEEESSPDDWFSKTEDHHTIAGGYQNVHIYFTGKGFQATHKWTNTDMSGVLRVIQVKEQDGYPVIIL